MSNSYLQSVSCIAFDFCGTLADLQPSSTVILGRYLHERFGHLFERERLSLVMQRASLEMPYSSLVIRSELERERYFVHFNARVLGLLGCDEGEGKNLYAHFKQQERHWVLKHGASALLRKLRARGYRIVLASNFDATLVNLLEHTGVADLFDAMFVSAELGVEKPDLSFYRRIQEYLARPVSEIAMVGDDLLLDVHPALEVGFRAVHLKEDDREHIEPQYILNSGYMEIPLLDTLLQVCRASSESERSKGALPNDSEQDAR